MPTITTRPPATSIRPIATATDQLLRVERYLPRRFVLSQTTLLVVKTYQAASGEQYTRVTYEPWKGL